MQISFFCGMSPDCDIFGSVKALEIAKKNVDQYFAVVGVLEQMQESLQVLENYVPAFFKDARKVYKTMMKERHVNENKFKPHVSPEVKNYIKSNFTTEIEFYNFCRQRLYKQYLTIK